MYNGVSAALLWSSEKQAYVGVLTVVDFIRALCHQYNEGGPVLDEQCVDSWLELDKEKNRMVSIGPEEPLARATSLLLASRIRRLPVCEPSTGNILCTIAMKHIARLIIANIQSLLKPQSWFHSLQDVGIGTYANVITITPQTTLIAALQLLIDKHISALPVISSVDERLIGIFSRTDAVQLAYDKAYMNLNRSVSDIMPNLTENGTKSSSIGNVQVCTMDETLGTVSFYIK